MKAYIVREECIGCGLCPGMEAEVFRMTEDDVAEVYGEVTNENQDNVVQAVEMCPVGAIHTEE